MLATVLRWPPPHPTRPRYVAPVPCGRRSSLTDATHLTVLQFLAAEIESMWQDQQGDMWAECRWWYFPEETRGGRRPEFSSRYVATWLCAWDILVEA